METLVKLEEEENQKEKLPKQLPLKKETRTTAIKGGERKTTTRTTTTR